MLGQQSRYGSYIHEETNYVTGISPAFGSSGNPSPVTAYGVFRWNESCCERGFWFRRIEGKVVAVQGVGNVAYHLCKHLHEEGAL